MAGPRTSSSLTLRGQLGAGGAAAGLSPGTEHLGQAECLQGEGEAGGEGDPGEGQPAGEGEQEEPQEEEAAEDETEGLEEGERPGPELGGGQAGEGEGRVGVEMLQGDLLVPPALLQPFLQTNVGVG